MSRPIVRHSVTITGGKFHASVFVGSRFAAESFDYRDEADAFIKRSIRNAFRRPASLRNLKGHVGCDFIDAYGLRNFSFQILDDERYGIINIDIVEGDVIRWLAVPSLDRYREASIRLAKIYMRKSIPQRFGKQAVNAH